MNDKKVSDIFKLSYIILIVYSILTLGAVGYLVYLDALLLDRFYPKAVSNRNGILVTALIIIVLLLIVLTWIYRLPTFKKHRCIPFAILYIFIVGSVAIIAVLSAFALKRGEKDTAYQMIYTYIQTSTSNRDTVEWFLSKYPLKKDIIKYAEDRTTKFVLPFLVIMILWFILQTSITTYLAILKPPFLLPKNARREDRKRSQKIEDTNEPI